MLDKNLGRRNFIKTLAVLAGMTVAADVLTACGDTATTVAAPTATSGTTSPTTTTTTSSSSPTILSPITAAPTTSAANPTSTTVASTTTAATSGNSKNGQAPKGYAMLGAVSKYTPNGDPVSFTVSSTNGFVYNSNGDFYVFNDICTHQGCEVSYVPTDSKFECPCHGSQYDKTGEVVQGPARKRLKKYQTKVVNDTLYAKIS